MHPDKDAVDLPLGSLHGSLSDPMMTTMNFLNEVTARYPDAISFAPGRPSEEGFSCERVVTWLDGYIAHLAAQGKTGAQIREALFQYGPTAGFVRDLVARSLATDEGIDVSSRAIVITVGCQEAMVLTLRALFAGPRDVLLVAVPCYVGIVGAARLLGIRVVEVPEGPQGLTAAELARAVAACRAAGDRPRACYLVPDHANPAGHTAPLPGRRELLAVAAEEGILLLEDSPYRLVSTATRVPSLKALDEHRRVVHLGSFAKSAFPGLRIGYVVADQQVSGPDGDVTLLAEELAKVKSMITLNTPSLSQAVLGGFLVANDFSAARYARPMADHYDSMLRAVLAGLEEALPPAKRERLGVRWNQPEGGFFITVEVPFEADEQALARAAERHGVIWTPMRFFYPSGGGARALRLSCSYLAPEQAREGTRRLAESITAECGELLGSS